MAGPGTGKSKAIEERFRWLYVDQHVDSRHVFGISFTRASSKDLRLRVVSYFSTHQVPLHQEAVRVSTLHSLALSILARAHMLDAYPARPLVLDD